MPSNGSFWFGGSMDFPGFLYKKNTGVGARKSTKMAPGGNKVNRVLGNNNILGSALVKFGNGGGIFIFALDQQLLSVLLDTNKCLFIQRGGPIVEHNRFVFNDG